MNLKAMNYHQSMNGQLLYRREKVCLSILGMVLRMLTSSKKIAHDGANVPVADIDDKWLEGTREAIKAIGDDIDNEPDDDIAETADALKDVLKEAYEACGLQFSNTVMDDMASAIANHRVFVEFMKKLKEKGLDKKFMEL